MTSPNQAMWGVACDRLHHDLKTMARNMVQLSDWIDTDLTEADINPPDSVKTCLGHISGVGAHLQSYATGIDRYLRAGSFGPGSCSVADTLASVLDLHFPDSGVRPVMALAEDCIPLPSEDFAILLQVLISNVLVHSDLDVFEIEISSWTEGDIFYLTLADRGVGIPPESLEKAMLFGRRISQSKGTNGFGLASVHKICALHAGEISLSVTPETGGLIVQISLEISDVNKSETDAEH